VSELTTANHIDLAAEIVSAFVSNNSVPSTELPALIANVHSALAQVANGQTEKPVEALVPPVSIKKSITPDFLISLEDGRRYKSLKRHLTGRGLTPQAYREKWGLPLDYPMVAPSYAKQRSDLAKALGLGQLRRNRATGSAAQAQAESTPEPTKAARGRRKRTAEAA
jgi:predicted transcriptional regulator